MKPVRRLALLAAVFAFTPAAAEEIAIRDKESVLAIITHKGGFAAGRAHNHLIVAAGYEAQLGLDPAEPLAASFTLDLAARDLAVDPWDAEQAWYPRLEALGVLDEAFSEVAEKDREKIRKSMLGDEQLDAAKHPRISARLTAVEEGSTTHGGVAFPYVARLALEVHGQRVEKPVAARYGIADGTLTVEALGTFRFTDFGIEPFSAFFGAVKNEDAFHVYVNLQGSLPAEPAGQVEVGVTQR